VIIDPAHKNTGLTQSTLKGDIILISQTLETDLTRVAPEQTDEPFIISSPGEYETKGVFVYGIAGANGNILYLIKADNLQIAHLAGLTEDLKDKDLEMFEGVDIAMVPVGGHGVLSGKQADKVVSQLEPHLVIPMNYDLPKLTAKRDPVDTFLSEMGVKGLQPENSLHITKSKLPEEETKIVLLQP